MNSNEIKMNLKNINTFFNNKLKNLILKFKLIYTVKIRLRVNKT